MSKLVETLVKNRSAFARMSICAILALVGSLLATVVDIGWLLGDMAVQTHAHHWYVLAGLTFSVIVQGVATAFFYQAIKIYSHAHPKKVSEKRHTKHKVSKQSEVIMHLNQRLSELEEIVNNKGNI